MPSCPVMDIPLPFKQLIKAISFAILEVDISIHHNFLEISYIGLNNIKFYGQKRLTEYFSSDINHGIKSADSFKIPKMISWRICHGIHSDLKYSQYSNLSKYRVFGNSYYKLLGLVEGTE